MKLLYFWSSFFMQNKTSVLSIVFNLLTKYKTPVEYRTQQAFPLNLIYICLLSVRSVEIIPLYFR